MFFVRQCQKESNHNFFMYTSMKINSGSNDDIENQREENNYRQSEKFIHSTHLSAVIIMDFEFWNFYNNMKFYKVLSTFFKKKIMYNFVNCYELKIIFL